MKKWIFMLLLAGSIQGVYAQKAEKKEKFNPNTPLFEELTDVKKKTDKFNLYLNMQGSFDAHFQNGFQEGDFNMHQLRIDHLFTESQFSFGHVGFVCPVTGKFSQEILAAVQVKH